MNVNSGTRRNNNGTRRSHPSPVETQSAFKQSNRRCQTYSPDLYATQPQSQSSVIMPAIPESSQAEQSRRKKSGNPSSLSTYARSFMVAIDEANSDRGRKSKSKQRLHNRHLPENVVHNDSSHPNDVPDSTARRERSHSRDSQKHPKPIVPDVEVSTLRNLLDLQSDYSGPLAAAEFAKLKREVDSLKKLAYENKKVIKKQNKLIEELKQQDSVTRQKLEESESQVQRLQGKSKKFEEFMVTAESNAQCQICMELLLKPYALSPCGHVLCVTCLQEWFRKAPHGDDDMDDVDNIDYLLNRRKTCPCCRTNVRHRPIPVFVIKSIATALCKVKGTPLISSSPTAVDSDPWEGLFPPYCEDDDYEESEDNEDENEDDDEDDEDDEDEDEDEDDEHSSDWYDEVFSYGTDSDEEPYQGEYVYPRWEPPTVTIGEDDYALDQLDHSDLNVLRRGATYRMLQEYDMRYTRDEGLIAHDGDYNRYYLGWNIRLSADDEAGGDYMQHLMDDMETRPERWRITEYHDETFDAHLLVREDEVHEYTVTDSDYYDMDVDDHD
ncbi:hypothetical protein V8B97DRAFT_2021236 [Scleroderma yunnanense]